MSASTLFSTRLVDDEPKMTYAEVAEVVKGLERDEPKLRQAFVAFFDAIPLDGVDSRQVIGMVLERISDQHGHEMDSSCSEWQPGQTQALVVGGWDFTLGNPPKTPDFFAQMEERIDERRASPSSQTSTTMSWAEMADAIFRPENRGYLIGVIIVVGLLALGVTIDWIAANTSLFDAIQQLLGS